MVLLPHPKGTYTKWAARGGAPIQEIRRYLGERIAMYVCWVETLNSTLLCPIIAGVATTVYGVCIVLMGKDDYWLGQPCSDQSVVGGVLLSPTNVSTNVSTYGTADIEVNFTNSTAGDDAGMSLEALTNNEATPVFALVICIWCSFFSESWKRVQITKAVEWDVTELEEEERPR